MKWPLIRRSRIEGRLRMLEAQLAGERNARTMHDCNLSGRINVLEARLAVHDDARVALTGLRG